MENNGIKKIYQIVIEPQELKILIEKHIQNKTNKKVNFHTKTTTEVSGYFKETEYAKTRYFIDQKVEIVGLIKQVNIELTEKEMKNIIKEIFNEYDVTYISFKSKLEHKYQYEFNEPIFESIHMYYAKKEKSDKNENWSLRRKF